MTLYDKIVELRKRSGLSQEELGVEIGVSRQAVSKWEMAQTTPDLNKIMALSEFFGVPTDFLLKDEYDLSFLESEQAEKEVSEKHNDSVRAIEIGEVQEYFTVKKKTARNFCIAIFMVFMSPFVPILITLNNEMNIIVGAIFQILVLVVTGILLVITFWNLSKYKYLKDDDIELAYGVRSVVEEQKKSFEHTFLVGMILGVVSLISFVIPMMVISTFENQSDVVIVVGACIMLLIFSFGLACIVYVITINYGFKKILRLR